MFKVSDINKGGGNSAVAKQAAYARYLARSKGKTDDGKKVPPVAKTKTPPPVAVSKNENADGEPAFSKKGWNPRSQRV